MNARAEGQNGAGKPRVIKRYANRKLYDTRESRYVILQELARWVREGEEIRIVDNTTKEDLTNVTLAQIIYEEQKNGDDGRDSRSSLRLFIEESRHRLLSTLSEGPVGDLQRLADDRIRSMFATAVDRVHQLQREVQRLQRRIEDLEDRLGRTPPDDGERGEP